MSAAPHLSHSLPANLYHSVSASRMWVLPLIHYIYHLLISILLYFPACKCYPSLSCLLSADLFITLSLPTRSWVPPLICPICWLLTSHSLCFCLLACKCSSLPILFIVFWPLSCSVFAHQVVSAIPCFSVSCLLTSLLLCFFSPACEYYPLFILFIAC